MKKQNILFLALLTLAIHDAHPTASEDVVMTAKAEGYSAFHDAVMETKIYEHAKKDPKDEGSMAPFTIFVPTNESFAAVNNLKGIDPKVEKKIITCHVVPGKKIEKLSDELSEGASTVGQQLIYYKEDKLFLDESDVKATIVKGPIEARNGMVYVIDKVLAPAGVTLPKAEKEATEPAHAQSEAKKEEHKAEEKKEEPKKAEESKKADEPKKAEESKKVEEPKKPEEPKKVEEPKAGALLITEKTAQALITSNTQLTESIKALIHAIELAQSHAHDKDGSDKSKQVVVP